MIGLRITALVVALAVTPACGGEWRYILPEPGQSHEHPPLRAVPLGREKPDDLEVTARFRGSEQQYAELVYGSPGSGRVAIVLDRISEDEADLYVDTQRNRTIEPRNRFEPGADGRTWRLPLDVAVVEGDATRLVRRSVIFRLGRSGRTLSFAARGYLEGAVELGGRRVSVRRMDGDGNGFFADPQDRLWIDLDSNGQWNPLQEQFLYVPILRLGETRYVVRSDALGERLTLKQLEGSGTVQLALNRSGWADGLVAITVTLIGRDGSVFSLSGSQPEVQLPVGDYRLNTLMLSLKDPAGGPHWNYIFSDLSRRGPARWHTVARDATLEIDPVGQLELATGVAEDKGYRPGGDIAVQPGLFTGDGLLINSVERDRRSGPGGSLSCHASIALSTADGKDLADNLSGFA